VWDLSNKNYFCKIQWLLVEPPEPQRKLNASQVGSSPCLSDGEISYNNVGKTITEGSFEVKLPTIWTDGKEEVGRVREEKGRRKKIREEKESEERKYKCAKR
jgi:hypothetical protein